MKKQFLLLAFIFLVQISLFAQTPNQFKYQAVLRNADGTIIANAAKTVTVEILQGSPTGTVLFTENHSVTTTIQGIINLNIGSINTTGIAAINWSANTYFVKISVDGTEMGTSQLLSVPYALNAKNVENETDPVYNTSVASGITTTDTINWNNKLDSFSETDPLYNTSVASGITIADTANWNNKIDSETDPSVPLGTVVGQLQYWNGTNWVLLPVGAQGQVLRINASNMPEWQNTSSPELYPPYVEVLTASDIESFSAQLNGNINARGFSSTVTFEWDTNTSYGHTINAIPATITGTSNTGVSIVLTGLQSNTTYHYRIKAANAIDVSYSTDMSFTTALSAPQLITTGISNVMALSATTGGNITYDGGSPVTTRGVCWSTTTGPTIDDSLTNNGSGTGEFISLLTNLTPGTTYYVRAYAANAVGTSYGEEISFTTQSGVISLTTTSITSITGVSAVSGGNVTTDGGSAVTAKGVCWSTSSNPTIADSLTNDGSGSGAFSSNITGLTGGITYYVRAYATNAVGTVYGNERSFTTILLPTLITTNANEIKGNSAKAGGSVTNNGGGTISAQGLCWSTSPNPTTADNTTTSFTAAMTDLLSNTIYYVRAYAVNQAGTGYGNEISINSGYLMGSSHAGGLVFYNDGTGHGLVCAASDQSTGAPWGCQGTAISGADGTAIGTGAQNTLDIIAGCTTAGIAAKLCADLVLGGYSDWFLPSKDELNKLYLNKAVVGGLTTHIYWSSSEYDYDNAWGQSFSDGFQWSHGKIAPNKVRAVRAF